MLLPTAETREGASVASVTIEAPPSPSQGTFGVAWKEISTIMVIESHSHFHSYVCYFMVIARFCLWFYLADVGTAFIIYIRDYSELLMNAVALAFILKLPEFLYVLLVPDPV